MKDILKKILFFFFIFLFFTTLAFFIRKSNFKLADAQNNQDIKIVPETNYLKIGVHIKGEVKNPGFYEFSEDVRINDVIKKAGGLTDEADINSINLASYVEDGGEIIIPKIISISLEEEVLENKVETLNVDLENENIEHKDNEYTEKNTPIEVKSQTKTVQGKININTAGKSELVKLNGIGDKTAQAIIDYRNKNGRFSKIDDIKKVKGIGDKKFEDIKEYIIVN